jgi:hypothetical protein
MLCEFPCPPAIAARILNADFKCSHLDEGSAPLWDTPGTPAPCIICQQATIVNVRHACMEHSSSEKREGGILRALETQYSL